MLFVEGRFSSRAGKFVAVSASPQSVMLTNGLKQGFSADSLGTHALEAGAPLAKTVARLTVGVDPAP